MTEEEYIEYIEWRAEQERKIEMTDIRDLVRPFSEIYTKEEVQSAKDETKLLQSKFDECVKMMSEPVKKYNIEEKRTRKLFTAKCGDKYLYELYDFVTRDFIYLWGIKPDKFLTRENCLKAISLSMINCGKQKEAILIQELTETSNIKISNEEYLSDETLEKLHEEAQQSGDR